MLRSDTAPLGPLESHAGEVVARARGRTLVLWSEVSSRQVPGATRLEFFSGVAGLSGTYDSIVSIGQLGTATNLVTLLTGLAPHMSSQSVLYFCEPTIASDEPTVEAPHDVTATLWNEGFTVIECRRFRARARFRVHEYCWGRARLTPPLPRPVDDGKAAASVG